MTHPLSRPTPRQGPPAVKVADFCPTQVIDGLTMLSVGLPDFFCCWENIQTGADVYGFFVVQIDYIQDAELPCAWSGHRRQGDHRLWAPHLSQQVHWYYYIPCAPYSVFDSKHWHNRYVITSWTYHHLQRLIIPGLVLLHQSWMWIGSWSWGGLWPYICRCRAVQDHGIWLAEHTWNKQ